MFLRIDNYKILIKFTGMITHMLVIENKINYHLITRPYSYIINSCRIYSCYIHLECTLMDQKPHLSTAVSSRRQDYFGCILIKSHNNGDMY